MILLRVRLLVEIEINTHTHKPQTATREMYIYGKRMQRLNVASRDRGIQKINLLDTSLRSSLLFDTQRF